MSAGEDQTDVERVLAGDISAFEGIVRRWQGALVNLAYRFCRDRGRAEEMAQEVFLRAYRALDSWRNQSAFSTWLFAIATNMYCSARVAVSDALQKEWIAGRMFGSPSLALPMASISPPQDFVLMALQLALAISVVLLR